LCHGVIVKAFFNGHLLRKQVPSKNRQQNSKILLFEFTCSPYKQTTPTPSNRRDYTIKRVGDPVGRNLALGDRFLLQKLAIETENSDCFAPGT